MQRERIDREIDWGHRKGATRAFPAQLNELVGTPYFETGHPILLPGNPRDGSSVMVAMPAASRPFRVPNDPMRSSSRNRSRKVCRVPFSPIAPLRVETRESLCAASLGVSRFFLAGVVVSPPLSTCRCKIRLSLLNPECRIWFSHPLFPLKD